MALSNPGAVFDIADDLLAAVAAGFAAVPIALPSRQYVHSGQVAFDCEQLVVSVDGLDHSLAGGDPQVSKCAPPRSINLHVWLIRCVPTHGTDDREPPSESQLTVSAETLLTDLWVLAYVIWNNRASWAERCASILLGPTVVVGPEGRFGGSHASLTVDLI